MITSLDLMARKKILDLVKANPSITVQDLADTINARPTSVRVFLREHKLNVSDTYLNFAESKRYAKRHADFNFDSWEVGEVKKFTITSNSQTTQWHVYQYLKSIKLKVKLKWKFTKEHLTVTRIA